MPLYTSELQPTPSCTLWRTSIGTSPATCPTAKSRAGLAVLPRPHHFHLRFPILAIWFQLGCDRPAASRARRGTLRHMRDAAPGEVINVSGLVQSALTALTRSAAFTKFDHGPFLLLFLLLSGGRSKPRLG